MEIVVKGSVAENMPAAVFSKTDWIRTIWMSTDPAVHPGVPAWFRPNIRFEYDHDLRRYVRYKFVNNREGVTGGASPVRRSGLALSGGPIPVAGATAPLLAVVMGEALLEGDYVQTFPVFPALPPGAVIYEGRPL